MSTKQGQAFDPKVVLGLLLFGAIAFIATLYFIGAGETSRGTNDGGGHAAAKGLNGYAALADILEGSGHEVAISRNRGEWDDEGLLVLTPGLFADPDELDDLIEQRRYQGPTLLILPKWFASEIPDALPIDKKPGWVFLGDAVAPDWIEDVDAVGEVGLSLDEADQQGHDWRGMSRQGSLPDSKQVLSLDPDALVPIVSTAGNRILVGYVRDGGYYPVLDEAAGVSETDPDELDTSRWNLMIVAEPDLFNNYGMASEARAELAHAIVDLAMEGEDLPVTFDLTLNGLGKTQNLLTLAFAPPFLAATLCLVIAMIVVAWRAFRRFGPPVAEERAIAFGKQRLVANSAGFIQRTRRLHLLTAPYAALMRQRFATRLRLRHADDDAIDAAVERTMPGEQPFSHLVAMLEQADKPGEILRAAGALKSLERKLAR